MDSSQSVRWGEEISVERAIGWKVVQSGIQALWLGTQFIIQKLLTLSMFTDWYLLVCSLTICCNCVFWSYFTLHTYQVLWGFSFYLFFQIVLHYIFNATNHICNICMMPSFKPWFFLKLGIYITCNHIYCNINSICSVILLICYMYN